MESWQRHGHLAAPQRRHPCSRALLTTFLAGVLAAVVLGPVPPLQAALQQGGPGAEVLIGADDDNLDNCIVHPPGTAADQSLSNTDVLDGGFGNDIIIGLLGSDVLHGNFGHDILIGGTEQGRHRTAISSTATRAMTSTSGLPAMGATPSSSRVKAPAAGPRRACRRPAPHRFLFSPSDRPFRQHRWLRGPVIDRVRRIGRVECRYLGVSPRQTTAAGATDCWGDGRDRPQYRRTTKSWQALPRPPAR